jgi:hypothetical protein
MATVMSPMHEPIDLGDGPIGVANSEYEQHEQFFLASYDATGTFRWSKGFLEGYGSGVATLSNGDIAITGHADSTLDVGCGPVSAGVYIANLSSDGVCQWMRTLSEAGDPRLALIGDDLVVAGRALGAPEDSELGPLPGSGSLFVERISSVGTVRWSRVFGQIPEGQVVSVYGIATSPAAIWIDGSFTDSLDLGSGAMVATSQNGEGFLARLAP